MTPELTVHGFETSNNIKVRIALGYKQIPYEFRTIDPGDRDEIVRISGQNLTPVLVHGDRVLFDSAAILRYLEANFRETPRLFGANRDSQWEIEDWEYFGRTELAGPMMAIVHRRVAGTAVDDDLMAQCSTAFGEALVKLATRLGERQWLVGDTMSAADITSAAVVYRIRSAEILPASGVTGDLARWVDRVMAFDGKCRVT